MSGGAQEYPFGQNSIIALNAQPPLRNELKPGSWRGLPTSLWEAKVCYMLRAAGREAMRQLMTNLKRIQARARELARSGKFHGWRPISFELRFEKGYEEARDWLHSSRSG